jgi:hypothetical protein
MNMNISICPTSLEVDGDRYDEAALLAAIRVYIEARHPGARITRLQVGHRQGDAWARIDGDDNAGEELMAEFFERHGADETLFLTTAAGATREQAAADDDEALAVAGLVCGRNVEEDASGGQGHCWRLVRGDEMPASIRAEIEAEMIDGGVDSSDDYMASNGCHYRW